MGARDCFRIKVKFTTHGVDTLENLLCAGIWQFLVGADAVSIVDSDCLDSKVKILYLEIVIHRTEYISLDNDIGWRLITAG